MVELCMALEVCLDLAQQGVLKLTTLIIHENS
jgi:hypothetical protein